jgi:hypothetical protein
MKPNLVKLLFAMAALAIVALACSFSATTANIPEAYMSVDADGTEQTTVYPQDATFYAIARLANAPEDTEVRAVWIGVDVEGEEPNTQIHEVSITSADGYLTFDLFNELLWPIGQYRVDLYINGELETSVDFQVQ